LARKPRFRINPNRIPDDSAGLTPTTDQNLTLAETSLLSLPSGSRMSVEDLLSNFPLRFVDGQALANFQTARSRQ